MTDGYAFIGGGHRAIVVIDDVVTKENLIEWGWARGPVTISGQPSPPPNPKAVPTLLSEYPRKYVEELLRSHLAMEVNGSYYLIGGSGAPPGVIYEAT